MGFADALAQSVQKTGSITCVGLDPRLESLPSALQPPSGSDPRAVADAFEAFCREILDVAAGKVACVKPQSAFFEALGPPGVEAMAKVISHARQRGLLVIVDAKRNDIGSTASAYAKAYLGKDSPFGGDALTVSPYLGEDSLEPFCERCDTEDAGLFVLVKTSNPGGGMLQDRVDDGRTISQRVADLIRELNESRLDDCGYGPIGSVVGATYPQQLAELRQRMPNAWILIPGYGAQGGGADDIRDGLGSDGLGAVVNSSRHIIFAYNREEYRDAWAPGQWQRAVEASIDDMNQQLSTILP